MPVLNRYVSAAPEQKAIIRAADGALHWGIIMSKSASMAYLWVFDSVDGVANMDVAHLIGGPYPIPAGRAASLTSDTGDDRIPFTSGCVFAVSTSFDSYVAAAAEFRFNAQTSY